MAITDSIPDLGISASGIAGTVVTIITVLLIAVAVIIFVVWFLLSKRFKNKIIIFEKINNKWEVTGRDKAMAQSMHGTGDTCFYLRKSKKYLPTPNIQTGKRTYWFAIREDGEWINIGLGDVDEQMREVGANFLHTEMRYARTQLMSKIKERYDKPSFWAQYAGIIVNIAAITIIMVFLFLIVGQLIEITGSIKGAIESARTVLEETRQIIGALDNLQSGGGGIVPT